MLPKQKAQKAKEALPVACPTCGKGLLPMGDVDGSTGKITHRDYGCLKCEKQMESYLSSGIVRVRVKVTQDKKVTDYLKARSTAIAAKEMIPLDK